MSFQPMVFPNSCAGLFGIWAFFSFFSQLPTHPSTISRGWWSGDGTLKIYFPSSFADWLLQILSMETRGGAWHVRQGWRPSRRCWPALLFGSATSHEQKHRRSCSLSQRLPLSPAPRSFGIPRTSLFGPTEEPIVVISSGQRGREGRWAVATGVKTSDRLESSPSALSESTYLICVKSQGPVSF